MNKPKGWYNTVLEINKELELRKQGKDFHPLDLLLSEQTKILIQLFNECEFVGFPKADTEAETIVSNVLVSVQNSLTEKMDFVPDNPFFNLYLGLCYLENVLQLIKNEYESNLNTTIEYLENIIYQSEDYKNLVEVSRNIGRNIINNKQHPDFGILKKHIAEQLEYIERNNKTVKALPPQQTKTDKLKAPVLGLFCSLINKIGIDKKDETESATVYCERICDKFKLPYTDRVRQNYNVNETKKLMQELTEKVLPLIDNETKILIQKHLDSKQPPKQNLYA